MQVHQFKFTGVAKEYFGIWIVNLFLSIVTLGIYSAWAKVRRLRYFYANTYLDGHNFEYHARPLSILIGRGIVLAVLLIYNLLLTFTPFAAILIVPYFFALPWVINKAIRFRARVTSYRTIRFDFRGTYWQSFVVFTFAPFIAVMSLGALAPIASKMMANYIGNNLRYGTAQFATDAQVGKLYKNLGSSLGFFLLSGLIISTLVTFGSFAMVFGSVSQSLNAILSGMMAEKTITGIIVGMYIAIILAFLFYRAGARNVAYNGTVLDGRHRFQSRISRFRYVWILVSNLFVSILTLGLMRPWAALRSWRYKVQCTQLESETDLGAFIEQRIEEGGAAGAEFLDIEGIDFGF